MERNKIIIIIIKQSTKLNCEFAKSNFGYLIYLNQLEIFFWFFFFFFFFLLRFQIIKFVEN